jgi:hypothetical protein
LFDVDLAHGHGAALGLGEARGSEERAGGVGERKPLGGRMDESECLR